MFYKSKRRILQICRKAFAGLARDTGFLAKSGNGGGDFRRRNAGSPGGGCRPAGMSVGEMQSGRGDYAWGRGTGAKPGKEIFFGGIPACARPFRLNALGAANEIAENRRANRHSGSSSCVISDTVPSCWCGLPGNLRWSHSILPILLRHPTAKGAPLSRIWSRAIGRRKDI